MLLTGQCAIDAPASTTRSTSRSDRWIEWANSERGPTPQGTKDAEGSYSYDSGIEDTVGELPHSVATQAGSSSV